MTTLIACSHGTHSLAGRQTIADLIDQVRELLPGVAVEAAFVDVQQPAVDEAVERIAAHDEAVVVPLLLSTGYHTETDIARAVAAHPGRAVATAPLGPHDALVDVLESRLAEAGADPGEPVVLAAAGSSDPRAAEDVAQVAALLAARLGSEVRIGFAAGAGPRITEAIGAARAAGGAEVERIAVASYVLAPGYFADLIAGTGGEVITAPLAPDRRVAAIIAERFRAALPLLASAGVAPATS